MRRRNSVSAAAMFFIGSSLSVKSASRIMPVAVDGAAGRRYSEAVTCTLWPTGARRIIPGISQPLRES
jgi:hypothetical protein